MGLSRAVSPGGSLDGSMESDVPPVTSPLIQQFSKRQRRLTLTAMTGALGDLEREDDEEPAAAAATAPTLGAAPSRYPRAPSAPTAAGAAPTRGFGLPPMPSTPPPQCGVFGLPPCPTGPVRAVGNASFSFNPARRSPPGATAGRRLMRLSSSPSKQPRRLSGIKRRACGDSIGPDLSPEAMAMRAAEKFGEAAPVAKDLIDANSDDEDDIPLLNLSALSTASGLRTPGSCKEMSSPQTPQSKQQQAFECGLRAAQKSEGWADTVRIGVSLNPDSFARGCKASEAAEKAAAELRQKKALRAAQKGGTGRMSMTSGKDGRKKRLSTGTSVRKPPKSSVASHSSTFLASPADSTFSVLSALPSPSRSILFK
eukprot:SRR837773.10070.p2 GENE.SRR837773.10070~~SRR837773.10070.p2  ORF type:complete len:395 (+),score=93.63 SRR837773.10070:80-1186(+)